MEIGERIHARRLELGLTLEQVGDAVGVGKSTVRKWEQGMIKNMRRDKIQRLADVLRVDPVDFIMQPMSQKDRDHIMTYPAQPENEKEYQLLLAFRAADERAQDDALQMLRSHKK